MRPGVHRIQHVLVEPGLQLRELLHHRLETALAVRVEAHARQTEIAQRMLDDVPLHRSEPGALTLAMAA